jgi:hypothetical protein
MSDLNMGDKKKRNIKNGIAKIRSQNWNFLINLIDLSAPLSIFI